MKMKLVFISVVMLLLLGCTTPTDGTTQQQAEQAGEDFGFELTRDWRVLSIMLTLLSGLLVALAYLFGQGFEMPELKAWAGVELVQIVATLVIIVSFSAVLTLLDNAVAMAINANDIGFTCDFLENCAIKTANSYLNGLIELSMGEIKDTANNALLSSWLSSLRAGLGTETAFWPPLLQTYFSSGIPELVKHAMYVEYYSQTMQFQAGILSMLSSQQFFVQEISFKIAPIILLMGIVARSFFFTRKLGGMMMAAGLGIMFVFPGMYVVNWLTLNITLFGDDILLATGGQCPATCSMSFPQYYVGGKSLPDAAAVREYLAELGRIGPEEALSEQDAAKLRKLRTGESASERIGESSSGGGVSIYSCEAAAKNEDIGGYCPSMCREVPLPLTKDCTVEPNPEVERMCDPLNPILPEEQCSVIANDPESKRKKTCNAMPDECKIIRTVQEPDATRSAQCSVECKTTLPLKYDCSNDCLEARDYCRVAQKKFSDSGELELIDIARLVDMGRLPPECIKADSCAQSLNPQQSCVYVHPANEIIDRCSACIFTEPEYTLDPPTYTNCAKLCDDSPSGAPMVSTTQFAKASEEGMFGREETKAVSALIIPAYILPLLNIVVTLMFIRTFSPIFGGDIEIPGVSKLI